MSKDKEIISRLFKIVAKQQEAITKLAQAQVTPVTPPQAMRAAVQADIIDSLYGKGVKMIPGKVYAQVHYAKVQASPQGNVLLVGLTVPANAQNKWDGIKTQLAQLLKSKYSASMGQQISSIEWRE